MSEEPRLSSPPPRKVDSGSRTGHGSIVAVTTTDAAGATRSHPLAPRHDLCRYAADFDWGQDGPGATQLALAILAGHLEDGDLALELHERFKLTLIALLPRRAWALGDDTISRAVRRLRE
jgi:hypothetical protein